MPGIQSHFQNITAFFSFDGLAINDKRNHRSASCSRIIPLSSVIR